MCPMGWYEKIALALRPSGFRGSSSRPMPISSIRSRPTTQPLNFELHPFGRPIAVTHIAGNLARDMERKGEAEMIDFALGGAGQGLRLATCASGSSKATTTHWSSDPYINGAYSCAKPGHADARRLFAEPIHERIFLAGEHVHPTAMATAHGAYRDRNCCGAQGHDRPAGAGNARAATRCGCRRKQIGHRQGSFLYDRQRSLARNKQEVRLECRGTRMAGRLARRGRRQGPMGTGTGRAVRRQSRARTPPDLDELIKQGSGQPQEHPATGGRGTWIIPLLAGPRLHRL